MLHSTEQLPGMWFIATQQQPTLRQIITSQD